MNTAHLRRIESSGSPARVLLILSSVAVIGCLLVGIFLIWLLAAAQPAPVTPEDQGFLFPVAEIHAVTDPWTIRTESEKYAKVRYREQHVELWYQYNHPEEDLDLKMESRIAILPTPEEAGRRAADMIQEFRDRLPPLQKIEDASMQFAPRDDIVYLTWRLGVATTGHCLVHKQDRGVLLIQVEGDVADSWEFGAAARPYIEGLPAYLARFE